MQRPWYKEIPFNNFGNSEQVTCLMIKRYDEGFALISNTIALLDAHIMSVIMGLQALI